MKSSPTKKNRCVRHVWWWPWLLLKASFNCLLQRTFLVRCKMSICLLFHTLNTTWKTQAIMSVISYSALLLTPNADTHARAPRGLPDQHTSTHCLPPSLQAVNPRDKHTFHTGLLTFTQINWGLTMLTNTHCGRLQCNISADELGIEVISNNQLYQLTAVTHTVFWFYATLSNFTFKSIKCIWHVCAYLGFYI